MLVPLSYNLRSLFVRKSATLLTVLGIGATVAIFSGVFALQQGFSTMFLQVGRPGQSTPGAGGAITAVPSTRPPSSEGKAVIARAGDPHGVSNETQDNLVILVTMAPRPS